MAQSPRSDRSRSPPLHAHNKGENKAWSNFGAKSFISTPVYVTPTSWHLGSLSFETRSIAGPGPAAGPAGPAGPSGPGPALEAAAAGPAGSDDDPALEAAAAGPAEPARPANEEAAAAAGPNVPEGQNEGFGEGPAVDQNEV